MLKLEEYILKRKEKEDLDEFDLAKKQENMKYCIDFVFEYFNEYLDENLILKSNDKESKKVEKYRQRVRDYSIEVQNWLVDIYKQHKCYMDYQISNVIKKYEEFLLYTTENEFNKISYNCYSQLNSKYPFLEDNIPQLNNFIKDYQRVLTQKNQNENYKFQHVKRIIKWVENTKEKYDIDLSAFAYNYLMNFDSDSSKWDAKETPNPIEIPDFKTYDLKKSKNKFDIQTLYFKVNYKPFMKNRKRDLELLLFLIYASEYVEFDEEYIKKYLESMQVQ